MGKAFYESPKGVLVTELIEIFSMVTTATMGGIFLALGAATRDQQGLLFTYSRAGDRYQFILLGVVFILIALGAGIVRRIILVPPAEKSKEQ